MSSPENAGSTDSAALTTESGADLSVGWDVSEETVIPGHHAEAEFTISWEDV